MCVYVRIRVYKCFLIKNIVSNDYFVNYETARYCRLAGRKKKVKKQKLTTIKNKKAKNRHPSSDYFVRFFVFLFEMTIIRLVLIIIIIIIIVVILHLFRHLLLFPLR